MTSRVTTFVLAMAIILGHARAVRLPDSGHMHHWVVHVPGGVKEAHAVATQHGLKNHGQVGLLNGYFRFSTLCIDANITACMPDAETGELHTAALRRHPKVRWAEQQVLRVRTRRDLLADLLAGDETFSNQWHLHSSSGRDLNVLPAWATGYTGKGIRVCVVDDGIEHKHLDLVKNYNHLISTDLIHHTDDATPDYNDPLSSHGTRCCGQVAAQRGNHKCGVGISYNAEIGGVKILGGGVTDQMEADALNWRHDLVDVYSNSWGPNDGNTMEGPARLAAAALVEGVRLGRSGLGSVFVWASGNGGASDNCNCDGYANSIYTIGIGAVGSDGRKPYYVEPCAAAMAVTYSSGSGPSISTVDWKGGCASTHGGTSAAAPNAAGVLALALEANENKATWRDVQHIVVNSARITDPSDNDWKTNGAGFHFNHKYGFGVLDAGAITKVAATWQNVGAQVVSTFGPYSVSSLIPTASNFKNGLTLGSTIGALDTSITNLEHVQVHLTTSRGVQRGNLEIQLTSPDGTESVLLTRRSSDYSQDGLDWTFMTLKCWGERPVGQWHLSIFHDSGSSSAHVLSWTLILYGYKKSTGQPVACTRDQFQNPLDGSCQPCHAECDGCTGPTERDCSKCAHVSFGPACVESCTALSLTETPNKTCVRCHTSCDNSGCSGDLPSECQWCKTVQLDRDCVEACPSYYFLSSNKTLWGTTLTTLKSENFCWPCHSECSAGCTGPTAADCSKGLDGNKCVNFELAGVCVPTCPIESVADVSSHQCHPCHELCNEAFGCTGTTASNCVRCAGLSSQGNCVSACPVGEYPGTQSMCLACHQNCGGPCFGPLKTQCCSVPSVEEPQICCNEPERTCTAHCGGLQQKHACVDQCEEGYFANGASCQDCAYDCLVCTGPHEIDCQACSTLQLAVGHVCVTSCPLGTFESDGLCQPCDNACVHGCSATGPTNCHAQVCEPKSCAAGYRQLSNCTCEKEKCMHFTYNGECLTSCPHSTFAGRDGMCTACHILCDGCTGAAVSDCKACRVATLNGMCVEECPDTHYLWDGQCVVCHGECLGCYGATAEECISCRHVAAGNSCASTCLPTQYVEALTDSISSCRDCHPECKGGCTGPSNKDCGSCLHMRFDGKCVEACPAFAFNDGHSQECKSCHPQCLGGCHGPAATDCISCKNFRYGSMCLEDCLVTTFRDYNSECQDCHVNCGDLGCYGPDEKHCQNTKEEAATDHAGSSENKVPTGKNGGSVITLVALILTGLVLLVGVGAFLFKHLRGMKVRPSKYIILQTYDMEDTAELLEQGV